MRSPPLRRDAFFFTLVHNFSPTFFTNSIDAANRNAYLPHRLNRELENLRLSWESAAGLTPVALPAWTGKLENFTAQVRERNMLNRCCALSFSSRSMPTLRVRSSVFAVAKNAVCFVSHGSSFSPVLCRGGSCSSQWSPRPAPLRLSRSPRTWIYRRMSLAGA